MRSLTTSVRRSFLRGLLYTRSCRKCSLQTQCHLHDHLSYKNFCFEILYCLSQFPMISESSSRCALASSIFRCIRFTVLSISSSASRTRVQHLSTFDLTTLLFSEAPVSLICPFRLHRLHLILFSNFVLAICKSSRSARSRFLTSFKVSTSIRSMSGDADAARSSF